MNSESWVTSVTSATWEKSKYKTCITNFSGRYGVKYGLYNCFIVAWKRIMTMPSIATEIADSHKQTKQTQLASVIPESRTVGRKT